jgi:succinyl-diaminopimelate desuccinylase
MNTLLIDQEVEELLFRLIAARSVNPPGDEVRAAKVLADYFEKHRLPFRMEFVEPDRPNIICELEGKSNKPGLLLTSHLDVVEADDLKSWTTDPFDPVAKEGRIFGRGACDAKGALASMAVTMVRLAQRTERLPRRVLFAGVMGEEKGGRGSKALIRRGIGAEAVILGEPTEMQVGIAHKGRMGISVDITGREAHASQPKEGINAISEMARLIARLEEYGKALEQKTDELTGSPSLTFTTVSGGGKRTSVAGKCTVEIDRRFIPGETPESVQMEFCRLLSQFSKETPGKVESRFTPTSQAYKGSPRHPLVTAARRAVEEETGARPGIFGFPASCDMYVFGTMARMATIVMGPGQLELAHRPNESIAREELGRAVRGYQRTVEHFFSEG